MNGVIMMVIAIVVLGGGYLFYGRYLEKKWGIDPNAKTPAYELEDGVDYVPADTNIVFGHQFASIAGAGPINGPIQAAIFGWLPVLLWILIGGVFFGAVQDFASMYASVKNKGRTIGYIIEEYIGKLGKKLFLLFCWLFCILVVAAFADVVAGTFNGFVADDAGTISKVAANGAVATTSMLFIVEAVALGCILKYAKLNKWVNTAIAIVMLVAAVALGLYFPMYLTRETWHILIFIYILIASVAPVTMLLQPRDYLNSYLLIFMIAAAVVGVFVANPSCNLKAFTSFNVDGSYMFPILFVTVACGAVSGFHSLVSSGTSSKAITNEKDMPKVGFGAMLLESLLAVLALCVAGAAASADGTPATGTPFAIFSSGVAGFLEMFGIPVYAAQCFMTMCVSALALTSLDSVARIGRMSFQELFSVDDMEHAEGWRKLLCNKYFATVITLVCGYILTQIGYSNIWPLFGSANQLLSALVLITLCVFLRVTGRENRTLLVPLVVMLCVTFTALVERCIALVKAYNAGTAVFMVEGLQLIIAVLLMVLGVIIVVHSGKVLFSKSTASKTENDKRSEMNKPAHC